MAWVVVDNIELGQECATSTLVYAWTSFSRTNADVEAYPQIIAAMMCKLMSANPWP